MTEPEPEELTLFLSELAQRGGDADPTRMQALYRELHRIAESEMRRQRPGHTLQATALVNVAFVKLFPETTPGDEAASHFQDRGHFFALAAKAMRHVLVDHARARAAKKRGGGLKRVPLGELNGLPPATLSTLLDVDAALTDLKRLDARQAQIVELRYFGGLEVRDVAETLDVSVSTVEREWRAARAWLAVRLAGGSA